MAKFKTFHNPFHTPFNYFTGGSAPSEVPFVYSVSINSHPYELEWGPNAATEITTLPIRRQSIDDSPEPGEQTLSAAGLFPRAQDNWFLGAGQKYMDNRFAMAGVYLHSGELPSIRTRFWKSQGVNVWNYGSFSLLPGTNAEATSTSNLLIAQVGNYIIRTDGKDIYYTASPVVHGTSTWTKVTSGVTNTNVITSLATDGTRLWFACGSQGVFVLTAGTWTVTAAATPAHLTAPQSLTVAAEATGTKNATNLPDGSTTYYVSAVDAFGNETAATSATVTVAGTPISLTWAANTNATAFNVYRGTNTLVYTGAIPSFVDDGSATGTTQSHPTTDGTGTTPYPATWLLYAKGHLLASTGRDLVEILASGNTTFIYQHVNPSFTFTTGCECETAILVGGYAGTVSYIGAVAPDSATSGATLAPPVWATSLGVGEQINSIVYEAGAVLLGTSRGIRQGSKPDSLGVFNVGPVISDPGSVEAVACYGQYGYFGWSNMNMSEAWASRTTVGGVGRCDLSQYTDPGIPAYATDMVGATAGVTTQVTIVNGQPYFVVNNSGTYTLYVPSTSVVASGWLEPGWVRYGTLESKILVDVDIQHEPLPDGATVSYDVVAQDMSTTTHAGSNSVTSSTGLDNPFSAGLTVGDRFMPIITLTQGSDPTQSPYFTSHILKALVVAPRQDQITLQLLWADRVRDINGDTKSLDTWNEYAYLKGLEESGEVVQLTMGSYSRQAVIDQIKFVPERPNDNRDWFNGKLTVKLISLTT